MSDSGTSKSLRFTSSATSLSLASRSAVVLALGFHVVANLLAHLIEAGEFAQFLGEFVIQLRQSSSA